MTSKFLSTDPFRFLYLLKLEPDSRLVFDKAYNVYRNRPGNTVLLDCP
jgi:hypothetical protein